MGQKENKAQLLRLLSIMKGQPQTLEMVTRRWKIDSDSTLIHDTETGGKVVTEHAIPIKDHYPLVRYPLENQFDTRRKTTNA